MVLLFTHTFACIWWFIGYHSSPENDGWQFRDENVARVLLGVEPRESGVAGLLVPSAAGDGSTIVNSTMLKIILDQEVGLGKQYLTSLYWATSLVMKSPWLPPSRSSEQVFAIISIVIGAMLFAAFIGARRRFTPTLRMTLRRPCSPIQSQSIR
jgi:hypothetical protein